MRKLVQGASGFLDGIGIRLPTICVRPGKPNKAASGFFSGIIREPLNGEEALLPVGEDVRHWHASPEPDAVIARIVEGWPRNFDAARAQTLGFNLVEHDFDDIIRFHIDDELAGRVS